MSEEQNENTEETDDGVQDEEGHEERNEKGEVKEPSGKEWVDFDSLPDDVRGPIEARFKRIYGHTKESERIIEQLVDDNKKISGKLDEFLSRTERKEIDDKVDNLRKSKIEALESGEYERVADIDNQMLEIRTRAVAEKATPPPKKEQPKDSLESGMADLPLEMQGKIMSWAMETASDGNYKRPWAQPGHPLAEKAVDAGIMVLKDKSMGGDVDKILREVDRVMGLEQQAKQSGAPVLTGDGGTHGKSGKKIKLTPEQEHIARKMYPKAKDPLAKYAAATQAWGANR